MFTSLVNNTPTEQIIEPLTTLFATKKSKKKVQQIIGFSTALIGLQSTHKFLNKMEVISETASEEKENLGDIKHQNKEEKEQLFPKLSEENATIALDSFANKPQTELTEEGMIVQNAGLILVHPFLKPLFQKLEFLSTPSEEKKISIIPSKIDEAVHTLHYLACREEHAYEHVLRFEKYLCNVPSEFPINRHVTLTLAQKDACDELLTAVLTHWRNLKSNSVALLRNEFLMREGKLNKNNDQHQLYIERKTQDILIDTLPWTISMSKLPWNKELLHTTW
ncbi:hypothetical protein ULVI_09510 [Cochleicola gelatinilyticus]|uniref:Uncharacterized protein n=1 Tax=Cochleicola gelatinilyticus TaxID=1763537 RepID=A0A167HNV4_9FLAO|nr:hypothetical protein ULVI_09510 [Cochleicola gelatinilyticus]